jgi:hypothetical protein
MRDTHTEHIVAEALLVLHQAVSAAAAHEDARKVQKSTATARTRLTHTITTIVTARRCWSSHGYLISLNLQYAHEDASIHLLRSRRPRTRRPLPRFSGRILSP